MPCTTVTNFCSEGNLMLKFTTRHKLGAGYHEKYLRIPQLMAFALRASLYRNTFMNTDMNQFLTIR